MKRNWDGDIYMAMLDCYMALSIDKMHLKSHFRLAKCLNDLKWHQDASDCLNIFCQRFPDYTKSLACENLVNEIKTALNNLKKNQEKIKKINGSRQSKRENEPYRLSSFYRFYDGEDIREEENENENEDDEDIDQEESEESNENEESNQKRKNENDNDGEKFFDCNEEDEDSDYDSDNVNRKKKCDRNNNNQKSNRTAESLRKKNKQKINAMIKNYSQLKLDAVDFKSRYCGHCNVATDIKEANFIGENYICAGSDDGSFFIWDKTTTNVVRVLKGDESIVNCIQPHPFTSMIATSGIDLDVKIWAPKFGEVDSVESGKKAEDDDRIVTDVKSASLNNQLQMNSHPFEFLFLNLNQNQSNFY